MAGDKSSWKVFNSGGALVQDHCLGKCRQSVDDHQSEASLECEICLWWFHVSCVGVPAELVQFFGNAR